MVSYTSLDITGYDDRPIENTWMRQSGAADHVAIVFPGYAYRVNMPALYYPGALLAARGANVLAVDTAYDEIDAFQSADRAQRSEWILTDAEAAARAALAQGDYCRVTLVGKSIGTMALGYLVTSDDRLRRADCVWLTPLLRDQHLREQMAASEGRHLVIIGSADSHHDGKLLREVQETAGAQTVVIDGADHSLEVEGDLPATLEAMQHVIQAMDEWLQRT